MKIVIRIIIIRLILLLSFTLLCNPILVVYGLDPPIPTITQPPTTVTTVKDAAKSALNKLSIEFKKYSTFAAKHEGPVYKTFLLKPEQKKLIISSLQKTIHWEDILLLFVLGWCTVPLLQIPYAIQIPNIFLSDDTKQKRKKLPYQQTLYYQIADHLQQITKIALAVYIVDIIKLICMGIFGMKKEGSAGILARFPHAFCQTSYTIWIANRIAKLKQYLLRQYINQHPDTFGRMKLFNRIADAIIYFLTIFIILNILQVEMGVAMQSILAFGSVGTLAMGLASQGIAKEILTGLIIASSDRIYEGDEVQFGNGITGKIIKLGWMETVLRGKDEIIVCIPNTHLSNQRVSNLSRIRYSQVKQVLRIKLDDVDKIPALIDRIKYEIQLSCPQLVTDGTRPFRVYWTSINNDHCEITIDTRHYIKPTGDAYLENKQNTLHAIYRALKKLNCKLIETSPIVLASSR